MLASLSKGRVYVEEVSSHILLQGKGWYQHARVVPNGGLYERIHIAELRGLRGVTGGQQGAQQCLPVCKKVDKKYL